jgi:hypothetical protein
MNQFNSEHFPEDPDSLPPARRRRAKRLLAPISADERAAFLAEVAHRTSATFDFFLFSILAGIVFSIGLLMDSPIILVAGALLSPLMAPAVGLALGTVVGSIRYFLRSLAGMVIGSILVFGAGYMAGQGIRIFVPTQFTQAHLHAQLSGVNLLVLAVGALFTAAFMVRRPDRAVLPSVAMAYALYLPLTIAGLGLASRIPFLWPDALVVFAIHLAWGVLLSALTLAILGFRPLTLFGFTVGAVFIMLGATLLVGLGGAGAVFSANIALPTPSPTPTATPSLTPTATRTPIPTHTPTLTPIPTSTPTSTLAPTPSSTPTPTPLLAVVDAGEAGGAYLREGPSFQSSILGVVNNGTVVQIISAEVIAEGRVDWIHVLTSEGREGWIMQTLIIPIAEFEE